MVRTKTTMAHKQLFNKIHELAKNTITCDDLRGLTTKNGNTQVSERVSIPLIRQVLDQLGLQYEEAGSQQSKDFRNIHSPDKPDVRLDIEVKKTDGNTITFNDTCPTKDIWYLVLFTGKQTKRSTIAPIIIGVNGGEFVEDADWVTDYQREIDAIKDKYCRGAGKKALSGMMSVYVRPTYRADISAFLHGE